MNQQQSPGDRLAKLVLMLSSDQPGEVVAAASAINRLLAALHLDWHHLAQLIVANFDNIETEFGDEAERWISAGLEILRDGKLAGREREFVTDMILRFSDRPDFTPSPKQRLWFRKLYRRVKYQAASPSDESL